MGFRNTAQRAGWTVREAALDAEDRLAEAVLDAVEAAHPLHRLIETRIAWPVADAWRAQGTAARRAVATGAVTAVAGAATIGALAGGAGDGGGGGGEGSVKVADRSPVELVRTAGPSLKGVSPEFETGEAKAVKVSSGASRKAAVRPPVAPPPGAPPVEVARSFASAFVSYEVGEVDEHTQALFAAVAEKPLAAALSSEPPRLPASAEVPKAEVLNVVMGDRDGEKVEASVSLLRLEAASELRLTLERTPDGWHVTQVLG